MRTRIIRVGNSRVIRVPRPVLERCGLVSEVELETLPGQWVVRPAGGPRRGWAAAFEKMAQRGDDNLL